ncbi:copper chaperone PCu(A)C [Pseudoalteromonas sp. 1_2015MBL_MicDiv]|uniref:copper chaperone PCu(A)C n=1 Tax=Pseudoalteromonas sp. 1_2015MBL_MicDiv TaxID=1720343 RepID=UPI000BBFCC9C|nr:copper chaperone PCu(A)C [Pseudoalteromonas sp. 1_2015MBL_MicDiv]ATG78592.1 copper chaperone [Pseudoalteromonas sp. 1_2015MBL_MicDiv]
MTKQFFSMASALMLGLFTSSLAAHSGHEHGSDVAVLEVTNAQVREFLPANTATVGYLTLINHSGTNATLTKATIDGLGRVEIHEHSHVDGMMKMQQVESVVIKAHESVSFQPGGYHLMAFEPLEPLKVGQERKLTLYFSDGNRLFTNAQVVSLETQAKQSKPSTQHAHH